MAKRQLRTLICQQHKLANCISDCDTGREKIPPLPRSFPLSLSSFSSLFLPLSVSKPQRERECQPLNFYSSPKSLLAISVRQGRQQLLVITGSPSLLLSAGGGGSGEENMFQSQCLYLFIYFLTRDVGPHDVYDL